MSFWTILAIGFAIISLILAIVQLEWHNLIIGWMVGKKIISAKGINKAVRKIKKSIMDSGFKPEYIIGIDGGGYTVASLLAQELNIKKGSPLPLTRKWGPTKIESVEVDSVELEHISYIADKKILLVDDVSATGATLEKALKGFERLNPEDVKVAVIVRPIDSELDTQEIRLKPDFYDFYAYKQKLKGNPGNVKLPWSTFGI